MPPLLEIKHITKRFGHLTALDDVNLRVGKGEIYGVLGENGAGKSTLMHILAGAVSCTSGEIIFDGRKVAIESPRMAFELGVGMVYQHFKLVDTQNGLENLTLFAPGAWLKGITPQVRDLIARWTRELNWNVDWRTPIAQLSVSEQQRIEIIKALCLGGRLLILDEPTAALTPAQADSLLAAVRRLAQRGLTVLLISHKLAEVKNSCDRLLVLRRGRAVLESSAQDVSTGDLVSAMIGQDVTLPPTRRAETPKEPVLELTHEDTRPAPGRRHARRNAEPRQLIKATLRVCAGEIVGVCGVEGNGQVQLAAMLTGEAAVRGKLVLDGTPMSVRGVGRYLRNMGLIPADRQRDGLILSWPINHNLILKTHARPPLSLCGILRRGQWRKHNQALVKQYDIRTPSLNIPAAALSGGNQQKVILARELAMEPHFLLAMNPTRGLDVGAAAFVMRQMLLARNKGMGLLLIHDDLDEVLRLSDRLYVMFGGCLYQTPWPNASRDQIGAWMLGENLTQLADAAPPPNRGNLPGNGPVAP